MQFSQHVNFHIIVRMTLYKHTHIHTVTYTSLRCIIRTTIIEEYRMGKREREREREREKEREKKRESAREKERKRKKTPIERKRKRERTEREREKKKCIKMIF